MPVVTTDTHKPMYLRGLREPKYGFTLGQDAGYVDPLYIDPSSGAVDPSLIVATDPLPLDLSSPAPLMPLEVVTPDSFATSDLIDPLTGQLYSDETASEQQAALDELAQVQAAGTPSGPAPGTSYGPSNITAEANAAAALAKAAAAFANTSVPVVPPAMRPSTPYQPPTSSQGQNVQLPPGSAPRVGVPPALQSVSDTLQPALKQLSNALTAQTIPGIPNWLFVAGIGLFLMGGRSAPRRRRTY